MKIILGMFVLLCACACSLVPVRIVGNDSSPARKPASVRSSVTVEFAADEIRAAAQLASQCKMNVFDEKNERYTTRLIGLEDVQFITLPKDYAPRSPDLPEGTDGLRAVATCIYE